MRPVMLFLIGLLLTAMMSACSVHRRSGRRYFVPHPITAVPAPAGSLA